MIIRIVSRTETIRITILKLIEVFLTALIPNIIKKGREIISAALEKMGITAAMAENKT